MAPALDARRLGAEARYGAFERSSFPSAVAELISAQSRSRRAYYRRVIDEATEFGARVARHLREETVVWLTTVTPSGAPLPRPVGFLWDGDQTVAVYSQPGARIRNIGRNPRVTLNFGGDGSGGDIVVFSGTAEVVESEPSAALNAAWVAKYAADWKRGGMTAESFAQRFSVPLRIRLTDVHGR